MVYLAVLLLLVTVIIATIANSTVNKHFWTSWNKKPYNFCFTWMGKKLWYSRSNAVVGFIYYKSGNNTFVLATQRGSGTPDEQGKFCVPCGYLEWGESCEQAIQREVEEETGAYITSDQFTLTSINSNPKDDKRQNVTFRYAVILSEDKALAIQFNTDKSEKDEVDTIMWMNLKHVKDYDWAFNHEHLIFSVLEQYNKIQSYKEYLHTHA